MKVVNNNFYFARFKGFFFVIFLVLAANYSYAQTNISGIINTYGSITNISALNATLTSAVGFAPGDKILVIQMKGVSINPVNNINYGMITAYNNAGNYELTTVASITGNVLTFSSPLLRTYNSTGVVQAVKVPVYANATITASLTCQPWNGTTGGVLAFEVNGTLTFNSDINITGRGFRGGNPQPGNYTCAGDTSNYVMAAPSQYHGEKGEGVYLNGAVQMLGKGRNANGGGGGNDMNGGAGGGGNFGAGGRGGNMLTPLTCPPNVVQMCGAVGAQGLNYSNVINKIFMGGGGGTGSQNNGSSPVGGNGGAIAIIRACSIIANNKTIFSNGIDMATFYCIDGHGGGGAGGTVLLDYGSISGGLNVSAYGGKGGSDTYGGWDCHGKGGGGGGGIVWVNNTLAGISTTLTGGQAGIFTAPTSPCYNTSLGATAGLPGTTLTGLVIPGATPYGGSLSISASTSICPGQFAILTAAGGTSYTWMPSGLNSASISVSPTVSTTYTVLSNSGGGCTNSGTVSVVITNFVMPAISASTLHVCAGQSTTLTAAGATGYTWSPVSSPFNSVIVSPTVSTTYTVYGSSGNCTDSKTITINVNALPVLAAISSTPAVCAGNNIIFNGSGASTYTWNPGILTGSVVSVTPTVNTNYTLSATSAAGCTNTTVLTVSVFPLPVPVISNTGPLCAGNTLNLLGTGGITYSWSGPLGFTSLLQSPFVVLVTTANSGSYSLTVSDANGCINSTSTNVNILAPPIITAGNNNACESQNLNLSASGTGTFSWSGPNGFSSTQQNPFISNVQLAASGQYTVVATSPAGCISTAYTSVTVHPLPIPYITSSNTVCLNNNLNLIANGGILYTWNGPGGFSAVGQTVSQFINSISLGGYYQVNVTDTNGCSATASIDINVFPQPNLQMTATNTIGCPPLCSSFSISSSDSLLQTIWYMGNGLSSTGKHVDYCYTKEGSYTISATVKDTNGCHNTAQTIIQVFPKPIADFVYLPLNPVINFDSEVHFTDASHGTPIASWNWYFMNTAQYTSNLQNPSFAYAEAGIYAVALVVKSDKGCLDTLIRTVRVEDDFVLYIPNAFTPNADGLNDLFTAKGFGVVKFEMQIFDRWGERIFHTKSISEGWDGKYQEKGGECVEEGTYTWLINAKGVNGKAHELKGHVTLVK